MLFNGCLLLLIMLLWWLICDFVLALLARRKHDNTTNIDWFLFSCRRGEHTTTQKHDKFNICRVGQEGWKHENTTERQVLKGTNTTYPYPPNKKTRQINVVFSRIECVVFSCLPRQHKYWMCRVFISSCFRRVNPTWQKSATIWYRKPWLWKHRGFSRCYDNIIAKNR